MEETYASNDDLVLPVLHRSVRFTEHDARPSLHRQKATLSISKTTGSSTQSYKGRKALAAIGGRLTRLFAPSNARAPKRETLSRSHSFRSTFTTETAVSDSLTAFSEATCSTSSVPLRSTSASNDSRFRLTLPSASSSRTLFSNISRHFSVKSKTAGSGPETAKIVEDDVQGVAAEVPTAASVNGNCMPQPFLPMDPQVLFTPLADWSTTLASAESSPGPELVSASHEDVEITCAGPQSPMLSESSAGVQTSPRVLFEIPNFRLDVPLWINHTQGESEDRLSAGDQAIAVELQPSLDEDPRSPSGRDLPHTNSGSLLGLSERIPLVDVDLQSLTPSVELDLVQISPLLPAPVIPSDRSYVRSWAESFREDTSDSCEVGLEPSHLANTSWDDESCCVRGDVVLPQGKHAWLLFMLLNLGVWLPNLSSEAPRLSLRDLVVASSRDTIGDGRHVRDQLDELRLMQGSWTILGPFYTFVALLALLTFWSQARIGIEHEIAVGVVIPNASFLFTRIMNVLLV